MKTPLLLQEDAWYTRKEVRTKDWWRCCLDIATPARRDVLDFDAVCSDLANYLLVKIDYIIFYNTQTDLGKFQ